ncbi:MAG: Trk family potassium uptake protein, partial [Oscillospiraceae bacterium]|nr:Trk family potassium uptake protein [Oscillospiraceae bacterium]
KIINSLFHSVSLRTAGFNTIPLESLTEVTKFLSVILMFIGAAPGSTGGGIKVTTIVVLLMTVVCTMRGRDDTIIMKRRVDKRVVYKALSIITIGFAIVIITTGAVLFTVSGANETDALFESTSAFATVGVSVGLSASAGFIGKIFLILAMFLGRVGPVSVALSLSMNGNKNKGEIIPEAKILVG